MVTTRTYRRVTVEYIQFLMLYATMLSTCSCVHLASENILCTNSHVEIDVTRLFSEINRTQPLICIMGHSGTSNGTCVSRQGDLNVPIGDCGIQLNKTFHVQIMEDEDIESVDAGTEIYKVTCLNWYLNVEKPGGHEYKLEAKIEHVTGMFVDQDYMINVQKKEPTPYMQIMDGDNNIVNEQEVEINTNLSLVIGIEEDTMYASLEIVVRHCYVIGNGKIVIITDNGCATKPNIFKNFVTGTGDDSGKKMSYFRAFRVRSDNPVANDSPTVTFLCTFQICRKTDNSSTCIQPACNNGRRKRENKSPEEALTKEGHREIMQYIKVIDPLPTTNDESNVNTCTCMSSSNFVIALVVLCSLLGLSIIIAIILASKLIETGRRKPNPKVIFNTQSSRGPASESLDRSSPGSRSPEPACSKAFSIPRPVL
ncbi:unnamed protein product [Owenia fusiformis]|uniref:Uncharacterized protein n=1 Tax=Owenia fusiformis TaxID=6347 RepID=A0A8J1XUD4_OWEFU|nr:unnamed protein product [Owenia fusiformis]